jgi:large conductance mechanosensitive channel
MSILKEFKQFAMKGNVVDLAIGVIIGGAFGNIVTSLINNIITPLILKPAMDAAHLNNIEDLTLMGTIKYGAFLSSIINFIIIAFALFIIIKGINATKQKEEAAPASPPVPSKEELLLTEIRDLLKK